MLTGPSERLVIPIESFEDADRSTGARKFDAWGYLATVETLLVKK